jgi:hypothetical protein
MFTKAQETFYIHGLLPRLLDPDNSILIAEDLVASEGSSKETFAVIERLETEGLAKRSFGTSVSLSTLGREIARDPRGYTAHLRRQRWQTRVKNIHEALGAYGSILSAGAGILGVVIACVSLSDSRKATSELDGLRTRVHELEAQRLPAAEKRLAELEKRPLPAVQPIATPTLPTKSHHAQHRRHVR